MFSEFSIFLLLIVVPFTWVSHNFLYTQIGINPGLTAAHKGHHYAGPGNHFCESNLEHVTAYKI